MSIVPDEFYRIRRITKDHKKLHSRLMDACKVLAQLLIDDGDDETFKRAHARVLQTTKEVKDMIEEKTGSTRSPSVQASIHSFPNKSSNDKAADNVTLSH